MTPAVEIDSDLVTEVARDLIRIPSVNPPGNELPVAEYLVERMRSFGLGAQVQALDAGRANAIGRLPGAGSGALVFTGHLDVVPPGGQPWDLDPFAAELLDGRIYGRGAADMKGGVAAMAVGLGALAEAGFQPRVDIVLAATAGEETGMVGATALVETDALAGSQYLVVGEPSDLDVFIAEKGVLWLEITAYGRTAHGSMPRLGINAVSYMARLVPLLEKLDFDYETSDLLGGPSLSVNMFNGGNKTNVVPDLAAISVDIRTVPGQDHATVLQGIRDCAQRLAEEFHPDLRVKVETENDKKPVETAESNPLVRAAIESVSQVTGKRPTVGGVTYGTDAAALAPGFGIPMVICGPGSPGMAHQPNESVEIDQLVQAAHIYADLATRLAG